MNYLRCEYVNIGQHTKVEFEENLNTTTDVLEAFIRFMLVCGFQLKSIEDVIFEMGKEIENRDGQSL